MTIIFGVFILYIILNLSFVRRGLNEEYISKENSKKINGIFVMLVFFSHISQQMNLNSGWIDNYFLIIISYIGQLMVTTFIFYSGYGIYESIKKKKSNYIDSMPQKRILSTLIKFDIAVIIYAILGYIIGSEYSIKTILLSLTGWTSVGNSNWYIFSIIFMYIITYLSFKIFRKDNESALVLNTILVILFMYIMSNLKESWWYNTLLCYPFGMWYSQYKEKIEKFLDNSIKYYIILFLITALLVISFIIKKITIIYITGFVLSFISLIVLFSMKFKFGNNTRIFDFLGNNVFYIYIYQRIPMILLKNISCIHNNKYFYFILSLIITIIITVIANYIEKKVIIKKLNIK